MADDDDEPVPLEDNLPPSPAGSPKSPRRRGFNKVPTESAAMPSAAAFSKALHASRGSLQAIMEEVTQELIPMVKPPESDAGAEQWEVRRVVESACRKAVALLEEMSENDCQIHREGIKAQQFKMAQDLERNRRSSKLELGNQAAALEAAKNNELAKQAELLLGGEDSREKMLQEAQEKCAELTKELATATKRARGAEQRLDKAEGLVRDSQQQAAQLQEINQQLASDLGEKAALAAQRQEHIDELNTRVAEMEASAATLEQRLASATADAEKKAAETSAALMERDHYAKKLDEASKEMDRIVEVHAKEREKLTEQLEEALRKMAELADRSTPTTVVNALMATLTAELPVFEIEFTVLLGEYKKLEAAMAHLAEERDALRERGDIAEKLAQELSEELELIKQELARVADERDTALARAIAGEAAAAQAASEAGAARAEVANLTEVNATLTAEIERLGEIVKEVEQLREEKENMRADMERQVAEAAASAERAVKLKEDECKREVKRLAEQLREEVERITKEGARKGREAEETFMTMVNVMRDEMVVADDQLTEANEVIDIAHTKLERFENQNDSSTRAWKRVDELEKELARANKDLDEALSEVLDFKSKGQTLGERLTELINRFRNVKALLHSTRQALREVEQLLGTVAAAAAQERQALVQSALASLHHMQSHLASFQAHRVGVHNAPAKAPLRVAHTIPEPDELPDPGVVLLPFNSAQWWRAYGSAMEMREARDYHRRLTEKQRPKTPADARSRVGLVQRVGGPSLRRAAWHELRPAEERASKAIGGLTTSPQQVSYATRPAPPVLAKPPESSLDHVANAAAAELAETAHLSPAERSHLPPISPPSGERPPSTRSPRAVALKLEASGRPWQQWGTHGVPQ